jgi:rubredoxin
MTMKHAKFPIGRIIGAHTGAFAVSIAVGAVLALGVRSMFAGGGGATPMADAGQPAEHHADAGHEGHGHDAAPAATDDKPSGEKNEGAHKGHGAQGAAEDAEKAGKAGEEPAKSGRVGVLLELGNPLCPVMQGEVNGETFSEWNGLNVGHCCPDCNERFLENPESLLDEVSPKWREAVAAAKAIDAAEGKAREELLAKAEKSWKVVRQPVGKAPEKTQTPAGLLIDLANAACPVMGGDVDGAAFTEWNGLRVGHCCPGCGERFLANPEALLDEVAPTWREAVKAVAGVHAAKAKDRTDALARLRTKWKVVREPAAAPPK